MNRKIVLIGCITLLSGCAENVEYIKSNHPYKKFVKLHGSIDSQLAYYFSVHYQTTSGSNECRRHVYPVGWYPASKVFKYAPTIVKGKYEIPLPLAVLTQDSKCKWKPAYVMLCAQWKKTTANVNCTDIFYINSRMSDTELKKVTEIKCDIKTRICREPPDYRIGHYTLRRFNEIYQINIGIRKPNTMLQQTPKNGAVEQ